LGWICEHWLSNDNNCKRLKTVFPAVSRETGGGWELWLRSVHAGSCESVTPSLGYFTSHRIHDWRRLAEKMRIPTLVFRPVGGGCYRRKKKAKWRPQCFCYTQRNQEMKARLQPTGTTEVRASDPRIQGWGFPPHPHSSSLLACVVVNACNPSYSGGRGSRIDILPCQKHLKTKIKAKGLEV
jgi:hypothetical protein